MVVVLELVLVEGKAFSMVSVLRQVETTAQAIARALNRPQSRHRLRYRGQDWFCGREWFSPS